METLHKYAGKDATHVFSTSPNGSSLLHTLDNCIVGYYCQPEVSVLHTPAHYVEVRSILIDTERHLGYLCGLHAHSMCKSLPLQLPETASKNWLHAPFLRGGLQVRVFENVINEKIKFFKIRSSSRQIRTKKKRARFAVRTRQRITLPRNRR